MNNIGADVADRYEGKRVLITGGLGFMGLNLAAVLRANNAKLSVLSQSWAPDSERVHRILEGAALFKGDIRDAALVETAVTGCDVVFHLAGKSGSVASNNSPLEDLDVNVKGLLTLLEAARRRSPSAKIVFPSSRLVYSPDVSTPVAETAETIPLSIYGIHKLAAERYLLLYQRLYGLRSTILRITNPYGPFQRSEQNSYGVVNWFIHEAINDRRLPVYGDGAQLRDYIHIDDVVRAMLMAGISRESDGRVFNVGSGIGTALAEMVQLVMKSAGRGRLEYVEWPADAARVETGDFVANTSRITQCLGWRASTPLAAGIDDVIARYKKLGASGV